MRSEATWRLIEAGSAGVHRLRECAEASDSVLGGALSAAARSANTHVGHRGTTQYFVPVRLDLDTDPWRHDTTALLDLAVKSLDHPDAGRRAHAALAFGGMGVSAAGAEPALRGLLAAPEEEVRADAAEALSLLGSVDEETLQALIQLLGDADETGVRPAAAHALGA